MARHKNAVTPVIVQVKFTLLPGLHDRFIEYFQNLPQGQRAATILRDLDGGMAKSVAVDDDDIEDRLSELIG
jgi:hypothetical protein